jgi:hypothetical protein
MLPSHRYAPAVRVSRILAETDAGSESLSRMVPHFHYHPQVLDELARHGLVPQPHTPPGALRDAVRDLYKYEIRRLRESLIRGGIEKRDYAARVVALRTRYPLLSIPVELWVVPPGGAGAANPDAPD